MNAPSHPHKASVDAGAWPVFYTALSILFEAGVPITESFELLAEQTEDPALAAVSERLAQRISQGHSISDSLKEESAVINVFHQEMIAMGEENGQLGTVLGYLAEFEERRYATAQKLKSATAYPALLCIIATLSILLAPHYFEDTIKGTLATVGESLPFAAQVVFNISATCNSPWLWIGLVIAYFVTKRRFAGFFRRISVRKVFWSIGLKIPGLKKALKASSQERFARAMALQLESGQKIDKAIRRASRVTGNPFYMDGFLDAIRHVQEGVPVAEALAGTGLFDQSFLSMVEVGSTTGNLPELLRKAADMLTLNLESDLRTAMAALEPAVLLLAGGVVGGFVLTMMGPMSKLIEKL